MDSTCSSLLYRSRQPSIVRRHQRLALRGKEMTGNARERFDAKECLRDETSKQQMPIPKWNLGVHEAASRTTTDSAFRACPSKIRPRQATDQLSQYAGFPVARPGPPRSVLAAGSPCSSASNLSSANSKCDFLPYRALTTAGSTPIQTSQPLARPRLRLHRRRRPD